MVSKIITGGQSGVDRAATDFAIEQGIPYGGYVPLGGWAEDYPEAPGVIAVYPNFVPTTSSRPILRTFLNIQACDALLIIRGDGDTSFGTDVAYDFASMGKPSHVASIDSPAAAQSIDMFLDAFNDSLVLGIGGPRESESPGIYARTLEILRATSLAAAIPAQHARP